MALALSAIPRRFYNSADPSQQKSELASSFDEFSRIAGSDQTMTTRPTVFHSKALCWNQERIGFALSGPNNVCSMLIYRTRRGIKGRKHDQ